MRNQPARRRGRPKLPEPAIVYRLALTLRRGEDDDLIAFFAALPLRGRAAALKQALRGSGLAANAGALAAAERRAEAVAEALEQLLA